MNLRRRLKALEGKQPPFDLAGRYYDTLTPKERRRYWKYIYGSAYTVEEAERLEVLLVSGTLHFICTMEPGAYIARKIDTWEQSLMKGENL